MAVVGALAAPSLQANIVANSLPSAGSPDWVDFQFDGTVTANGAGESVLHTASGGNWFGWGYYSDPLPSWSLGSNVAGNKLLLTTRFSDGSRDWSAYLADGSGFAVMNFNPTGCNGDVMNCRTAPYSEGVEFYFQDTANPALAIRQFISLDFGLNHQVGFLLKGGLVSYYIDGNTYSGTSLHSGSQVLVIGDGSGSTQTGSGDMIVHAVSFDNAPSENVVLSVPEPASWGMMLAGFGLLGGAMRSRQRTPVTA